MRGLCSALVAMASLCWTLASVLAPGPVIAASDKKENTALSTELRTSDRCLACHNGIKTPSGEDVSIGFEWRASIMANSARDPYWQGSVRRETIDHSQASAAIQDECSTCHMPVAHLADHSAGLETQVFNRLPLSLSTPMERASSDGVSCSVCHQIEDKGLGTQATFNGNVAVATVADKNQRPEYGPFVIDAGHKRVMQSSTGGFVPQNAAHIRNSALCGSCHTLATKALGAHGEVIGRFPEQMPYKEWLHSDYPSQNTCQGCHMPEVAGAVPITAVYGEPRVGMHRHVFVGGNFLLEAILNEHRDELDTQALPQELDDAVARTKKFLQTQSARMEIRDLQMTSRGLIVDVLTQNLTGHKLPTAYPSRRAWLHVTVRDSKGQIVFESGALNHDGSIRGNDNDEDPLRYEPHYSEITRPDQVEIYEPILKDAKGKVTTGLLSAVGYLKDNRLLPSGFNKQSAEADIAVVGRAAADENFTGKGSVVHYVVPVGYAPGPFRVDAELWYQPIGYRWAHNLGAYHAAEPQRWVRYYEQAARESAIVLASAEAAR
jgi:hypothetical protein